MIDAMQRFVQASDIHSRLRFLHKVEVKDQAGQSWQAM
jgi:hypothetical protein